MNSFNGLGRLTRDPEIRTLNNENQTKMARFSIAITRRIKNAEGNYDADFLNCVAYGKTAELLEKYFKKGNAIGVTGRVQTGSYTNKDGVKVYTTDIVCETIDFVDKKGDGNSSASSAAANNDFMKIPGEIEDGELPFN